MVGEGIASSSVLVVKTHQQNVRVCLRNSLYSIIELKYIISAPFIIIITIIHCRMFTKLEL